MDHTQAQNNQAVERYFLGELSAADAEEFEHHFFQCQDCARAVEACYTFVSEARQVLAKPETVPVQSKPVKAQKPFWSALAELWKQQSFAVPAAAALFFCSLSVYQGAYLIPSLRQGQSGEYEARVIPVTFQLTSATRGDLPDVIVETGTTSFSLLADIPPDLAFSSYKYTLSNGNRTVFQLTSPAPPKGQPVTIEVRNKGLAPGRYELTVFGVQADGRQGDRISTYSFNFNTRQ